MRPQRWQPTRLPRPWDSPGKNTGVGCHFLLQCMKVKSRSEVAQSCPALSDPMDCSPPGSSIHGIFQVRVLEWDATAFSRFPLVEVKNIQNYILLPCHPVTQEETEAFTAHCAGETRHRALRDRNRASQKGKEVQGPSPTSLREFLSYNGQQDLVPAQVYIKIT